MMILLNDILEQNLSEYVEPSIALVHPYTTHIHVSGTVVIIIISSTIIIIITVLLFHPACLEKWYGPT